MAFETNYRPRLWPASRASAVIHALVARATVALPGLEDAEALTGLRDPDAVLDYYLRLGPRVVIATPNPMPTAVRARFFPGEDRSTLSPCRTEADRILAELAI